MKSGFAARIASRNAPRRCIPSCMTSWWMSLITPMRSLPFAAEEAVPEGAVPPAVQAPAGPKAKPAGPTAEEIFGAPPKKLPAGQGNPFVPPQP